MTQDATLHIKLDSETDRKLKNLAYSRGKSKGQLVREAITACYQTAFEELPLPQRQALAAYQGGFISMGKLAKIMGMHALAMRGWLEEHGVIPLTVYGDEDAAHA
jgi:predicted DNA-binding protein